MRRGTFPPAAHPPSAVAAFAALASVRSRAPPCRHQWRWHQSPEDVLPVPSRRQRQRRGQSRTPEERRPHRLGLPRSISSGDDARDATAMRPVGRPRRCLGGTMTTVPGTRWGGGDGDGSDGGDYRGGAERSGAGWGGSGRDGVVRRWCSLSLIEKIMMVSLTTRRACIFLSLAFGCPSLAKLDPSARRPARI